MYPDFGSVHRSLEVRDERGRILRFPNRQDYIQLLVEQGLLTDAAQFPDKPELVEAVYLDWLKRGQVGCVFAQLFGRSRFRAKVRAIVVPRRTDTPGDALHVAIEIDAAFKAAVPDPDVEGLTVLLPRVTTIDSLVNLLAAFPQVGGWKLESVVDWGATMKNIGLRAEVVEGVWAEILGLGPFPSPLPATRQAPVTALEIRPKAERAKFSKIHPRELLSAHLDKMDADDVVSPDWYQRLFAVYTPWLRRRMLGGAGNDRRAKAGVTFTVPAAVWNQLGPKESSQFVESG